MNAINKALTEIRFNIPADVLNIAFVEKAPYLSRVSNQTIGLDERIRNSVIKPRVLVDANLVGGVALIVYLSYAKIDEIFPGEFVISIPKHLTNGKSIMSIQSIVSNFGYINTATFGYVSPMTSSINNMYNNLSNETIMQSSRLELVGDNVIICKDPSIYLYNTALRCVVENDENMANLTPRFIPAFANLCVLAVKSYIYNMKVKLDQGYLYGGHELGAITEIIDSYSDAETMYQEFLHTKFKKLMYMNNSNTMTRHIRSVFSNNI